MNNLLITCQFLPLLGILLITFLGNSEHRIAQLSYWLSHLLGLSALVLLALWVGTGFSDYEFEWLTLYDNGSYKLMWSFYLNAVSIVYLLAVCAIFSIIVRYCRYYLHREAGYKRFFITIFTFVFGLNTVILANSIDMLFAGWEIVGISSFLLIAFYRDRIQPVRNAFRAYTVYRFCDVGLLLGAWIIHIILHDHNHFSQLNELFENSQQMTASYEQLIIISLLLVIAASGKSAQFPFCFWLPRAMEGPTPSSAIFYGALSVHLGVFLLLRTMPIWSYYFLTRAIIFSIGLLTLFIAHLAEKTQSSIKGQIAYGSIAQVGIMFMELAFGFEWLVLLHFLGNTFLRCYQLLVSPSIVAHKLRIQGAIDKTNIHKNRSPVIKFYLPESIRHTLFDVLQNSLYVFALQEGNLELLVRSILWTPLKRWGAKINAVNMKFKILVATAVLLLFLLPQFTGIPALAIIAAPILALSMLIASLSAFSRKHGFTQVWNTVALSSLLAAGAVWSLHPNKGDDIVLFALGIIPSWLIGVFILRYLLKMNATKSSFVYRANAERYPILSLALFFSFLGLVGFPITPAFIGMDLLLYHSEYGWLATLIAISFVINGVSTARVFLRLTMGRVEMVEML